MNARIREIVAEVIGVSQAEVGEDASPATLPSWDSLRHMNLIVALEDAFGVQFDDDALGRLGSVSAIAGELARARAAA